MPIVGFNIDKLSAEKINNISGKLEVKNNLGITNIGPEKLTVGKSEEVLKFSFEYSINYSPKVGNISMEGSIMYMEEPNKIKEIMETWKKDKKIQGELMPLILNTILSKCNIKALTMSQEVNLPPHIKLPVVKLNN